ncbi:hypothetical protein [Phenylobacterium sp.]|uniref:hypothetical protein n=1 Tax=Phenylobacterium sp. TaxID=1871053 RepID=UPI002FC642C5
MTAELKIELPDAERGLSPDEEQRLNRLLARAGNKRLTGDQRKAAAEELARMEGNLRARRDQAWLAASALETIALAEGRGEDVDRGRSGQIRAHNRDALLSLLRAGRLTLDEFDIGHACRELYERQSEDLGAMNYGDAGRADHDNAQFVHARLQRAKATQRVPMIERAIAVDCRDEPASLQMFRAVIGRNIPLSAFGLRDAFDRHVAALKRALAVADRFSSATKTDAR